LLAAKSFTSSAAIDLGYDDLINKPLNQAKKGGQAKKGAAFKPASPLVLRSRPRALRAYGVVIVIIIVVIIVIVAIKGDKDGGG
jgi:t-SNARE complex subunit (syntaxin)